MTPNPLTQALSAAIGHHQAGRLREAEVLYRQVLAADPHQADALHLLGVIALQVGRPDLAVEQIQAAIRQNGNNAEMHSNLGSAYTGLSRHEEAAESYRTALRLKPDFATAHYCLGNVLQKLGRPLDAIASYRRAIELLPQAPEFHNNLGVVLRQQGDLAGAVECFHKAVGLAPGFAEAHANLGEALKGQRRIDESIASYQQALQLRPNFPEALGSLGAALLDAGRPEQAIAALQQSIQLAPHVPEVHNNIGNAMLALKRLPEALEAYRRALQLRPNFAEAHNNLGTALQAQGKVAEALDSYGEAERLRPDFAEAHNNRSTALLALGQVEDAAAAALRARAIEPTNPDFVNNLGNALVAQADAEGAIDSYRRAIELHSDHADAHRNLGLALLSRGDWDSGWREFEWRWRCADFGTPPFSQPRWQGEPLAGKTIVLHAEQGLGDTIQFVRYAERVHEHGGRVVLQCQRPLLPLLRNLAGVDQVIAQNEPVPPHDFQAPLLSLPTILRTRPDNVPQPRPYLRADPARRRRWREYLDNAAAASTRTGGGNSAVADRNLGICWQGNPSHKTDWNRSAPLAALAPLTEIPGIRLVSLQVGPGREQIATFVDNWALLDPSIQPDETGDAFLDMAALVCELDLVITVDTVVAHLAGALGVPTWLAVARPSDWRWLTERDDTPWYRSIRLFRQKQRGNWIDVFGRMADDLKRNS